MKCAVEMLTMFSNGVTVMLSAIQQHSCLGFEKCVEVRATLRMKLYSTQSIDKEGYILWHPFHLTRILASEG